MIPAECTDRVNDPVHLLQLHAVHRLVHFIEICLDLGIVHLICLVVGFIEESQDGLATIHVWRVIRQQGFELVEKRFQGNTSQKIWVMLTWKTIIYK